MSAQVQDFAKVAWVKLDIFYDELDLYKSIKNQWNNMAIASEVNDLYRFVANISSDGAVTTSKDKEFLKRIHQTIIGEIDQAAKVLNQQSPMVAQKLMSCLNSALSNGAKMVDLCGTATQNVNRPQATPVRTVLNLQQKVEQLQNEITTQQNENAVLKSERENLNKAYKLLEEDCEKLKIAGGNALADLERTEVKLNVSTTKLRELEKLSEISRAYLSKSEDRANKLVEGQNQVEDQRRLFEPCLDGLSVSEREASLLQARKAKVAAIQLNKLQANIAKVCAEWEEKSVISTFHTKSQAVSERKNIISKLSIFQAQVEAILSELNVTESSLDIVPSIDAEQILQRMNGIYSDLYWFEDAIKKNKSASIVWEKIDAHNYVRQILAVFKRQTSKKELLSFDEIKFLLNLKRIEESDMSTLKTALGYNSNASDKSDFDKLTKAIKLCKDIYIERFGSWGNPGGGLGPDNNELQHLRSVNAQLKRFNDELKPEISKQMAEITYLKDKYERYPSPTIKERDKALSDLKEMTDKFESYKKEAESAIAKLEWDDMALKTDLESLKRQMPPRKAKVAASQKPVEIDLIGPTPAEPIQNSTSKAKSVEIDWEKALNISNSTIDVND